MGEIFCVTHEAKHPGLYENVFFFLRQSFVDKVGHGKVRWRPLRYFRDLRFSNTDCNSDLFPEGLKELPARPVRQTCSNAPSDAQMGKAGSS